MPLLFSDLCTLLSRLESIEQRDPPFLLAIEKKFQLQQITESWFKSYRRAINEASTATSVALLSVLLPERRADLVYGLQAPRLSRVVSRALRLSAARTRDIQAYAQPGHGDLGECLQRVLAAGGPPAIPPVSLDEVDQLLKFLAGFSRFSGPTVEKHRAHRNGASATEERDKSLAHVLLRLQPHEAKWLVRLILKDFSPVVVDEGVVLRSFHFLLPDLLNFQNDFVAAVTLLKCPLREYPDHPDPRSERLHRQSVARFLRPALGVKVGRPDFLKARSIDHCIDMLGRRPWVLERKYDGEYCEIHVDLAVSKEPTDCIKIFSKSGKDSTADRTDIHHVLVQCLRLGHADCKFKDRAILLGELVVYSDLEKAIMPFEEIRKHVSRSGRMIGTIEDAPPASHEHLAIVFFDVLVLDEENLMAKPVQERRSRLRQIYTKIPGRAIGAEWKIVDFSDHEKGRKRLIEQFAASIAQRCEGLVLKPCGVPYFSLEPSLGRLNPIKLKTDYIADMGDEADFAVIGASYDPQQTERNSIPSVKWSSFHLGCLINKDDVLRFNARPRYKVVATISHESCIPRPVLAAASDLGRFMAKPADFDGTSTPFDVDCIGRPKMDVIFENPFVFEVLGSGFGKPSNSSFLVLRHPRVKKLHRDRTWRDCVSFQELQDMAALARSAPLQSESQETRDWIEKLEKKLRKKNERESITSPKSKAASTPSLEKRVQSDNASKSTVSVHGLSAYNPSFAPPQLDGTTLLEYDCPPSAKRRPENVHARSSRPAKRFRTTDATCTSFGNYDTDVDDGHSFTRSGVLSDITNIAPDSPARPTALSLGKHLTHSEPQTSVTSALPTPPSTNRQLPSAFGFKIGEDNYCILPQHHPSSLSYQCYTSPYCLFANTVFYLSPCIVSMPYITEDLIPTHNATLSSDLLHWSRDSHALFEEPGNAEPESQSHPGQRKVVLIESRRRNAVEETVKAILGLNAGLMRERVEVWDWRALEICVGHDVAIGDSQVRTWFVGATMVDENAGRTIFVWERGFDRS